ncbi:MAG: glycosyltransferase family 2 protein [Candidatus Omnitrophota bacterium]|nr:glycosyltransferase family 2 protein [Candidatus Omnitrophota bacterium]
MFLSCVIVAKNEEKNIARCIESVLNCTKDIKDKEILLVDSCSSDRTVEIAKKCPVNIIGLRPSWKLSPAASRFSGVNNTTGEYILIIDGDMELQKGWVEKGLKFMEENPKVAVVVGKQYDVYCQNNSHFAQPKIGRASRGKDKLQKIDYVYGSSIFRREHLLKVGNFHPYLRAEEEAELSYRLKRKGYFLFFLPYKSTYHYCISRNTFQETMRRIKSKLFAGMGDMMRWSLQNKYYSIIWKRFKVFISFLAYMTVSIAGIVYFAFLNKFIFSVIFGFMPFVFVLLMCIKKKSVYQGILSTLNISIISISLICGLFHKVDDMSNYPTDVIWIKRA